VRYFLTRGDPPIRSILLIESGSRRLLERLIPILRQMWGEEIHIDLVTCYQTLPEGFRPETTSLYCVTRYRGRERRRQLYRELGSKGYSLVGIICSAERLMTKWKWALALRLPAKLIIINENADYFEFNRHNWRIIWRFVLLRSGLAGAGAVRTLVGLIAFPFTLMYLLLYATFVHTRRALRRS
jgi:hypothetical protein